MERHLLNENPAVGVGKINPGGKESIPWTVKNLKQITITHQPGTMAHRYITLLAFSACRIGDAIWLGSENIFEEEDEEFPLWLNWQPTKRNSVPVSLPILLPLAEAIDAIEGPFIVTPDGNPFSSTESLRN